jgi:hypothetical protein
MTLFEYLSIAYSLLFTLAAMRIVGGIPYAISASNRSWPHLLLVAILLLFVVELFWNFWSFRDGRLDAVFVFASINHSEFALCQCRRGHS